MQSSTDKNDGLRERMQSAFADFYAGRIGDAAAACRDIIDRIPNQPDALHLMAMIAYRMNRLELALQLFDETLKAAPQLAQAWSNRALVLRIFNRNDEALTSARNAIANDPQMASGWDIAGLLLRQNRDFAEAIAHHAKSVALDPNNALTQNNYAVALAVVNRLDEAWHAARQAEKLAPSMAAVQLTLANIISTAGHFDRSIPYYKKCRALDPSLGDAIATEGRAHFLMGDFTEGWECMEMRPYDRARFDHMRRWDGEKVKHLLLYAEQGIGDVIHFLRYVPLIADRAEKITMLVPVALKRLIAAHMPDMPLVTDDDPLPAADAFGLLMSAPYFLKTTLANVPAPIPYIKAADDWRLPWRERLSDLAKPRIGIVWAGNRKYAHDHTRSIAFDKIAPLLESAPGHFVSLQKETGQLQQNLPDGVFDAAPWLKDFTDTAGLIAELDLVISVDTAVAHLAGAMGKPVWTLLPSNPDWRWMLQREDSPWYPTMRLFRQPSFGDWPSVIVNATQDLRAFVNGDNAVLQPKKWLGAPPRQPARTYELPED